LLNDGRVFIEDLPNGLGELYSPGSGTFQVAGPSASGFASLFLGQWSTLISGGRVLVLGWSLGDVANEIAGIYDPVTGRLGEAGSGTIGRDDATMTLLANGEVLIAGGISRSNRVVLASSQLYDPATGKFTATGPMTTPRAGAVATRLHDGSVLISGGFDSGGPQGYYEDNTILASAEIYDPHTGRFTKTGSMTTARCYDVATLLSNDQVLIVGGIQSRENDLASAELYDPASGKFRATGSMKVPRVGETVTGLLNGKVLVAGGGNTDIETFASAELYDPDSGKFTSTGSMTVPRQDHTATLLSDGRVLVTGGDNADGGINSAELYYP
jgi:hypothetical protein